MSLSSRVITAIRRKKLTHAPQKPEEALSGVSQSGVILAPRGSLAGRHLKQKHSVVMGPFPRSEYIDGVVLPKVHRRQPLDIKEDVRKWHLEAPTDEGAQSLSRRPNTT